MSTKTDVCIIIFFLKEVAEKPSSSEKQKTIKPLSGVRHCAFCLRLDRYKLCSGCHKRAYCSKECQAADWSAPTGIGQLHKYWCKLDCGEEDVDFEVVAVAGKGLGIVAKKLIPAKYRIIVEGVHSDPVNHPAFKELCPSYGSTKDKFETNMFTHKGVGVVGLRISRANHHCNPNAGHIDALTPAGTSVEVLYANRDIQIGEEICISYFSCFSMDKRRLYAGRDADSEFELIKYDLEDQYGIICPADCACQDTAIRKWVVKGRLLYAKVDRQMRGGQPVAALQSLNQLLAIQKMVPTSLIHIANSHYEAFNAASVGSDNLEQALTHARSAYEIRSNLTPYDDIVNKLKETIQSVSLMVKN